MSNFKDRVFQKPAFGDTLSVLAGLSFFFNCMSLPLVGPAGSRAPYASKNFSFFLGMLMLTIVLSALATFLKIARRKKDNSPFPFWSSALCGACVVLLVLLVSGMLAI